MTLKTIKADDTRPAELNKKCDLRFTILRSGVFRVNLDLAVAERRCCIYFSRIFNKEG